MYKVVRRGSKIPGINLVVLRPLVRIVIVVRATEGLEIDREPNVSNRSTFLRNRQTSLCACVISKWVTCSSKTTRLFL
ncbi:hypothetical protein L1987_77519 [Smallanthus sonchifolius]|uniref:Uncharacterized protein n=1 Tax=Smallanthus sonchifolius TaxID=185202 RepID=A0ACB8Z987_9ASTR|nr:hypothetical protein L1987_77519 [Smallanthus sonchifolius]